MSWPKKSLDEIADFCLGKMLDEKKNRGELLPYLANVNVRWGEFDLDSLRQMRFEPGEIDRYGLLEGDIVMCEGGEPGRCAVWSGQVPGIMIQKALHRIRARPGLNHRYLYYSFLSKGRTGEFTGLFTGSTIKHLPKEKLAKVQVPIPPVATQERIADVLSAYDDLIENNKKRITLLEESARLLYREWFVHLRFPGHEHVKITNGVPEGWRRVAASDAFDVNPKTLRSDDGDISYFPMAALSETGMILDRNPAELRKESTSVRFRNGDTLFARITPCLENGKTGFVQLLGPDETACGSTEFIVLRGNKVSGYFVYLTARQNAFRENAIKSMIGSSGRQRVQPSCFDRYFLLLPPSPMASLFDESVAQQFKQIHVLDQQNQKIAEARDILLPRLMSGEVVA